MSFLDTLKIWNAKRDLIVRRADFYYDLASSLEDKVPLFTSLRKYEARARRRAPATALLYQRMPVSYTHLTLPTILLV